MLCRGHLHGQRWGHRSLPGTRCQAIGNWLSGLTSRTRDLPALEDAEPAFMAWLQQHGLPEQQLVAQQVEGQGRCLVAKAPIRRGQQLLCVPEQLLITPSLAASVSLLVQQHPQLAQQLPEWTLLALFLAELRYHYSTQPQQQHQQQQQQVQQEHGQQQQRHSFRVQPEDLAAGLAVASSMQERLASQAAYFSQWYAYYELLPQQTGCVLDWPQGEVQRLLGGTCLLSKANTILDAAAATWSDLTPYLTTPGPLGPLPPQLYSREAITWAISMCLTRSVRLDSRGGLTVLVPWADLLNHDPTADCYLDWEEGVQGVVLRPDRDYKPGEQVYISYGPKPSGELLLCYGFHPPPGSNPHESAPLTLQLREKDPQYQAKAAALASRGIPTLESFSLRMDALPAGLLPYLAFLAARPTSAAEVEELAGWLFDQGELPLLDGISTEALAWQELAAQCRQILKGTAPKAVEQAKQLAASVPSGGGMEQRAALAAVVQLREQQILARTEYVARQQAKQLGRARA